MCLAQIISDSINLGVVIHDESNQGLSSGCYQSLPLAVEFCQ